MLILTVQTLAPILTASVPLMIDLMASKEEVYTLPVVAGGVGEYVKHVTNLPSFVTFTFP